MTQTCEGPVAGVAAGPSESFRLATERLDDAPKSSAAQIEFCSPRTVRAARLKWLAARLHAVGPKPLFHFLDELESGAELRSTMETSALPADFIAAYGGDNFAPALHLVAERPG